MDKQTLLKRYGSHLLALERKSLLTAETYKFEIGRFLDWLEEEDLPLTGAFEGKGHAVGLSDLTRYLTRRRMVDGIDSRSVAKAISALRSFFRFLEDQGHNNSSGLSSLLQVPRRSDHLPEVHNKEDVEQLLSLLNTKTALGLRNRALYELIYSAGLRISEAVGLSTDNLFLDKNLARVRGKGDKERLVVFGDEAALWLKQYLKESRPVLLGHNRSRALFISRLGKRLSRKGIWKNYAKLAFQAGLSSKLHTLRHTFATELLAGGADLRSVQELLGHADLSTTQIYTHIDSGRLRDNHRKYLPNLKAWQTEGESS
ncbi:MAG: tyrosine-type recombinase/integrase [Treponema sp.]|nr:tyrosine-type recombinase/integrase [Treponema sp.]